jgi:NMD protein affecting ribosome stability and mRNA decay
MDTMTHFTSLALRQAQSARGCKRCGQPIVLSDGFGLSEGICSACIRRDMSRAPRRGLVERLLRAA